MSNTLTLNHPLTESDWDKIFDVELEKTKHIWYRTPSGKRVDFIRSDVLDKIRAEIADLDDSECEFEGYYKAVNDALRVIDKHIKGVSE